MNNYLLTVLSFVLVLALTAGISAAEASKTVPEGETVIYKSDGDKISGFLVKPDGEGPFPAIVVIHEWWGLNDQIKKQAKKLAKEGYVALAVDLYRGKSTDDPEEAHELMRGLPEDRAVKDMLAALSYLKTLPYVKEEKIGAIGWCMGGGFSLSLAINSQELAGAVIYYGRLVTDKEQLKKINTPIIGFFGEEDRGIPPSSVRKFEEQMNELGKKVDIHIYPGAGHAFANKTRPSYNKEAAEDSREKTLSFFEKHLKSD